MGKYSDFNIIPIGDHCAISIALREIGLRKQSYPFDWVMNTEQLYDTNIIYNSRIVDELNLGGNVTKIVKEYIGDALIANSINSKTNITFPHDLSNPIIETIAKYERRFNRLKLDLHKKNIFIMLTRHYYIEKNAFQKLMDQYLSYNSESIILFISGTNHPYFENINCKNVIFKHIPYDVSKFYNYDYTHFRPGVNQFLSEFLLN